MNEPDAIDALAALAHPLRMRAFRLLMQHGPGGLPAGEVARALEAPPSTLSPHLARLERARLVRARRERQRIYYAVDLDGTRAVTAFLLEDCCDGRPELCGYRPHDSESPAPTGQSGGGTRVAVAEGA